MPRSPLCDVGGLGDPKVRTSPLNSGSPIAKDDTAHDQTEVGYIEAMRLQWEKEAKEAGIPLRNQDEYTKRWLYNLYAEYVMLRTQFDQHRSDNLPVPPRLKASILDVLSEIERIERQIDEMKDLSRLLSDREEIQNAR